jgi:AcrR family transcriptional regulator
VSLRQIGAEAGSGNSSAVQYHFGTKRDLVRAILLYRLPGLNERRVLLAAMAPPSDLRAVLEAFFLPVVEHSEIEDSHYLTFIEHVLGFSTGADPFETLPAEYQAPRNAFIAKVQSLLPPFLEPIATMRIIDAISICLHTSATRERARREGSPVMSLRSQATLLVDGLVGYVTAPVSQATLVALAAETDKSVRGPVRG